MKEKLENNEVFSKVLRYAKEASSELGAWCADRLWLVSLSEEEMRKLEAKTERKFVAQKGRTPMEDFERQILELQEARKFVEAYNFDVPRPSLDHLSTKVMSLMHYLKDRFERPTEDKCIVFVKQRYTARVLADLFSHRNIGTPHLRVGTLVCSQSSANLVYLAIDSQDPIFHYFKVGCRATNILGRLVGVQVMLAIRKFHSNNK